MPATIALLATGLFAASAANAATTPATVADYSAENPIQTLQTKSTSWRDPAFGDMGWTHNSGWGKFQASKGQTVTISAMSSVPGLHPGMTVWFRGKKDTAPDNYVADHSYPQNANQFVLGATDETTGQEVGNIVMKVVKYGYDQDGNSLKTELNGIEDGVSGQLQLTFKAAQTGTYMFVLGGINPDTGVDTASKMDVDTEVTMTTR